MTENERVKEIRIAKHLTLEEFGKYVGVTKGAMSAIETGKRNVTDQMRRSICREFQVNEDWLRTGEGEMFLEQAPDELIASFIGDILTDQPDFRRRLISVLARMTPDEWALLERKIRDLSEE